MKTHLYWHPDIFLHDLVAGHSAMAENRLERFFEIMAAVPGVRTELALPVGTSRFLMAHHPEYVQRLCEAAPVVPGEQHALDSETILNEHTLRTLQLSVGAVCQAVDAVRKGDAVNAFCCGYAGHHAGPRGTSGFCFVNPIAIAARYALERGVQRLAILDFDTHAGNGTILSFLEPDSRVMFAETYQPGYPGKFLPGDQRPPHILRKKCNHPAFFLQHWRKMLSQISGFHPELVLVSAGFDAHREDPLSRMGLSDFHYQQLAKEILAITPRVVATLEGGYNLESAPRCAGLFLAEMVSSAQETLC